MRGRGRAPKCLATAGKRRPAPSLSNEIAHLYQLQPSKKGSVAGRPSFLTLRVAKNAEVAAEYCTQGAKANNPREYVCLGYLHRTGQGKPKSAEMAANWYIKAAKCGDIDAIYRISQFYGTGEGLKQDLVQQYAMLLLTGDAIPQAQEEAVRVKAQLSNKELHKAEKKAKEFRQNLDLSCAPLGMHDARRK